MKIQKFIISGCFICMTLLFMTGCGGKINMIEQRLWMLNHDPYDKVPQQHVDAISEAVRNGDAEAIYDLFSKTAQDAGISYENIEEMIAFLQPHINTISKLICRGEYTKNDHGVKQVDLSYAVSISVNSKIYRMDIGECVRDDTNGEHIGLTWIVVHPEGSGSCPDVPETGMYFFE